MSQSCFADAQETVNYCRQKNPAALPSRYPVERKPTTEAAIRTFWHGDIYAVLGDSAAEGRFVTRYYYNPGVPWMWVGAALMALGGALTLSDRRLRIGAPAPRRPGAVPQAA